MTPAAEKPVLSPEELLKAVNDGRDGDAAKVSVDDMLSLAQPSNDRQGESGVGLSDMILDTAGSVLAGIKGVLLRRSPKNPSSPTSPSPKPSLSSSPSPSPSTQLPTIPQPKPLDLSSVRLSGGTEMMPVRRAPSAAELEEAKDRAAFRIVQALKGGAPITDREIAGYPEELRSRIRQGAIDRGVYVRPTRSESSFMPANPRRNDGDVLVSSRTLNYQQYPTTPSQKAKRGGKNSKGLGSKALDAAVFSKAKAIGLVATIVITGVAGVTANRVSYYTTLEACGSNGLICGGAKLFQGGVDSMFGGVIGVIDSLIPGAKK